MLARPDDAPFTIVERKFPVLVATFELTAENVVVASTPLILDEMITSFVVVATARALLEITELVAITPLMVVVSVLPVSV